MAGFIKMVSDELSPVINMMKGEFPDSLNNTKGPLGDVKDVVEALAGALNALQDAFDAFVGFGADGPPSLPDAPTQPTPSPVATLLAEIKTAADNAGVDVATIAQEWAESHGGQAIGSATDVGGLELVRDTLRGQA